MSAMSSSAAARIASKMPNLNAADGDVGDINSLGDEQIQWRIAEHAPRPHRSGQVEGKGCLAEFKTWNLAKIGEVQWIIIII